MKYTFAKIGELINRNIVQQHELQGHKMTGAFEESLEVISDEESVTGVGNLYGIFVNAGVQPSQIKHPFARARIDGLTRFVERRMGMNGKEAVSVAYAIATKHKSEGMPTGGSYQYSKNGKRTDFIDDAIALSEAEMFEIMFNDFVSVIDKNVNIKGKWA